MGWKIDHDRPAVDHEVAATGRLLRSDVSVDAFGGFISDDVELVGRPADGAAAATRDALSAGSCARVRLPE